MTEKERFNVLENEKIDKDIYYYLKNLFSQLTIEIIGRYVGNLFDLMKSGKLEGWCWQTTESAALFMQDDVIIFRGDLYFSDYEPYYHSFIEFEYEGVKYVFDPCLKLINTSKLYFDTFKVNVKGKTTAKRIKEYFIDYINNPPKKDRKLNPEIERATDRFMRRFFGDDYLEEKKNEIVIHDKEDPFAPMYRNGSGYKNIEIENNKIKKLTVHYYING